jgi:hypothetical protein
VNYTFILPIPQQRRLQIPIELIDLVMQMKWVKPFQIYLYLKCVSNGKIYGYQQNFQAMSHHLHIKSNDTLKKHLKTLLAYNWIGHDSKADRYYIRSFDGLRKRYGLRSRQSATFKFHDLQYLQAFLAGALICDEINSQKYFWDVVQRKKQLDATTNQGVAKQSSSSSAKPKPEYYGKSLRELSTLLHCSQTRACELKQAAENGGYIKTKGHMKLLFEMPMADYNIRKIFGESEMARRVRIKRKHGSDRIQVLQQQYDEIEPKIGLKRITKFSKIRLSA